MAGELPIIIGIICLVIGIYFISTANGDKSKLIRGILLIGFAIFFTIITTANLSGG